MTKAARAAHKPHPPREGAAPLSLRAYAKRRGTSVQAVSVAIKAGRLSLSVVRTGGVPKIADPDLADREWDANTRPRIDVEANATSRDYAVSRAAREAAAVRRELAAAEVAELELRQLKGELIEASDAAARFVEVVTAAKTKLLGLPVRARQRLPHLSADDVRTLDDLVRQALEELAADG